MNNEQLVEELVKLAEKIIGSINKRSDYLSDIIGFGKELKKALSAVDYKKLNTLVDEQDRCIDELSGVKSLEPWENLEPMYELSDFIQSEEMLENLLQKGRSSEERDLLEIVEKINVILSRVRL